ncbi:MAG: methyltransferase domain-containing protein [Holosporaceae bacterium]|jgi:ubiquinone/menaquinone biosynthesis C-methylase UbiE|nr:methyltransferase domain-containing protein [Holosporaceae bacterium]
MKKIVEKDWDYSKNAEFYKYRPNYSPKAIKMLAEYVEVKDREDFSVADIGAGTGNLTVLLLNEGFKKITAVEPSDEMRRIGEDLTKNRPVWWIKGTATDTSLCDQYDWVTFGSSFNVVDRCLALAETYRILKDDGYFTCLWNHRNLLCPIQKLAEEIIKSSVPEYDRGVRREDQRPFLEKEAQQFKNICYVEVDFNVQKTIDEYIFAWKSVKKSFQGPRVRGRKKRFLKDRKPNSKRIAGKVWNPVHDPCMDNAKEIGVGER